MKTVQEGFPILRILLREIKKDITIILGLPYFDTHAFPWLALGSKNVCRYVVCSFPPKARSKGGWEVPIRLHSTCTCAVYQGVMPGVPTYMCTHVYVYIYIYIIYAYTETYRYT